MPSYARGAGEGLLYGLYDDPDGPDADPDGPNADPDGPDADLDGPEPLILICFNYSFKNL